MSEINTVPAAAYSAAIKEATEIISALVLRPAGNLHMVECYPDLMSLKIKCVCGLDRAAAWIERNAMQQTSQRTEGKP